MDFIPYFKVRPQKVIHLKIFKWNLDFAFMSYAFWRGYRTWWQSFSPSLLAWLAIYIETGWDLKVFVSVALIPPLTATIAWVNNRAAQEDMRMDMEGI